ncbi:MAG: AhpC/TSA family protein [Rhodospirillales bacterium]|nr:AhpC/TSA family protein [Rhodospirillales bacterium]
MTTKPTAGGVMPAIEIPLVGGGTAQLGGKPDGWRLVVVYRGLHCPLCKKYLKKLDELRNKFEAINVSVLAVSGDPQEKAEEQKSEQNLGIPIAYGLSQDQMRTLGIYISNPRSPQETDQPFPEPAIFAVNPDGNIQVVDMSNAPFSRPDLEGILNGLTFIQNNDYPVRGTAG